MQRSNDTNVWNVGHAAPEKDTTGTWVRAHRVGQSAYSVKVLNNLVLQVMLVAGALRGKSPYSTVQYSDAFPQP